MAVNIKFDHEDAVAVCSTILSKPVEERRGITGFWRVNLDRVKKEKIIRLADMNRRRFLLEAEIDDDSTHRMDPKRKEEYIDHELVKKRLNGKYGVRSITIAQADHALSSPAGCAHSLHWLAHNSSHRGEMNSKFLRDLLMFSQAIKDRYSSPSD